MYVWSSATNSEFIVEITTDNQELHKINKI